MAISTTKNMSSSESDIRDNIRCMWAGLLFMHGYVHDWEFAHQLDAPHARRIREQASRESPTSISSGGQPVERLCLGTGERTADDSAGDIGIARQSDAHP